MPLWFQTETRVRTHPKMVRAGRAACWTWLAGNCYAKDQMTDGFIPDGMLASLVPGASLREIKKDADALIAAGLWIKVTGGYQIHDYLQYNDSKAVILAKREKDRNRKPRKSDGIQPASEEIPRGSFSGPISTSISTSVPEGGPEETAPPRPPDQTIRPSGVQGRGAFEPNSLPRDHMRHALCGGQMRLCLSETVYGKFITRYGGPEAEARKALQRFVDAIEIEHQALGNFLWLDDHFTNFLRREGRLKDAAPTRTSEPAPIANTSHDQKIRDIEAGVYGRRP